MEMIEVRPGVIAFVRPEEGANASLIHTRDGAVVVDTTSSARDMAALLDAAGVRARDVCLVVNTHQHTDHVFGNQLFACPIVAHRLCLEAMVEKAEGDWRLDNLQASIAERGATDPQWAAEMRRKIEGLQVTLPTETFEVRRDLVIGDMRIELVHLDGHSPGSSVVWLPGTKVLFSGDLLFVGRYPFLGNADIPGLIGALKRLPTYGAETIVPGHGPLCGEAEVQAMLRYIQGTWDRAIDHLALGHTADETAGDPDFPRYAEGAAERYHETNIRLVCEQLTGADSCPL